MDVPQIVVPVNEARASFKEYRASLRQNWNETDHEISKAYKELMKQHPLISLKAAMSKAGLDHRFWPKLAIARASWKKVQFKHEPNGGGAFREEEWTRRPVKGIERLSAGTFPTVETDHQWKIELQSTIPIIPPRFRPKASLENYHILWEANWEQVPPEDPMLLRKISKDLFAVLAVWDLTPVERAVLQR